MKGIIKKILVYIDGTEQSITAAQYAVCLCKTIGAELHVAYIINTRALNDLVKVHIFLKEEEEEYRRDIEADANRYLNHVKELARKKGISCETMSTHGTVHAELKKYITENSIDLLVIGEISFIRSRRDEFYNEAERAMRNAPCSVVMVKDEEKVWAAYDALT
ncbi:MAG: universal stress protein [Spirochaetales bacterium]|nr:universal stress protein [Spirochaetales bacterium]